MENPISTAAAAKLLRLSVQQVRYHARKGHLPGVMIGRDWVFQTADVKSFKPRPRGRPKS